MVSEITIEGFERLLKMIEERFGKLGRAVGIALLVLAGFALAGFLMNVIFHNILVPAQKFADLIETNPKNIVSIVYRFFLLVINAVGLALVVFWMIPDYLRSRRERRESIEKKRQWQHDYDLCLQQLAIVTAYSAAVKNNVSALKKQTAKGGKTINAKIFWKFVDDLSKASNATGKKIDKLNSAKSLQSLSRPIPKRRRKQARRSRGKSRA